MRSPQMATSLCTSSPLTRSKIRPPLSTRSALASPCPCSMARRRKATASVMALLVRRLHIVSALPGALNSEAAQRGADQAGDRDHCQHCDESPEVKGDGPAGDPEAAAEKGAGVDEARPLPPFSRRERREREPRRRGVRQGQTPAHRKEPDPQHEGTASGD